MGANLHMVAEKRDSEEGGGVLAGVLIHPLTAPRGEDTMLSRRRDHELGFWSGAQGVLPLDYDFLHHNVYDCSVCDPVWCTQAC